MLEGVNTDIFHFSLNIAILEHVLCNFFSGLFKKENSIHMNYNFFFQEEKAVPFGTQ